jgi:hypothetical protein
LRHSVGNERVFPLYIRSYSYDDELVWGAIWLYRATGNISYLNTAERLYKTFELVYWTCGFVWDTKISGIEVRNL